MSFGRQTVSASVGLFNMSCKFRQRTVEIRSLGVVLFFSLLLQTGCTHGIVDGGIFVEGRAYEWVNAPPMTPSRIYVDELLMKDAKLVPLAGVRILLLHGGEYARRPIDETTIWKNERLSDPDGSFHVGGITAPEKFHAAIRAWKEGFSPAERVFLHDKIQHTAVVVMVRTTQIE